MTERVIITGVAWADLILTWVGRAMAAGLILAGLAGAAVIIWGINKR